MMRQGFLLDIDYITEKDEIGTEQPVIRLWCKSKEGADFIVLDKNFEPYFYAFPSPSENLDIEQKKKAIENITISKEDDLIRIKRVELCQKKFLGIDQKGLKIFVYHPRHVSVLRDIVGKIGFNIFEADILFTIRYLIDHQLKPFDGITIEGEEEELSYGMAIVASKVIYNKTEEKPSLKILAFDCEMATQGGYGMPSPTRDPIIIISIAYYEADKIKSKLFVINDEDYARGNDEKLIQEFLDFVGYLHPDIIVGYNSDGFDWPYIRERAKSHRFNLRFGADGSTIHFEKWGILPGVNITGMLNVDLYKLARRDLDSVKVKKLENVAEYLGVVDKNDRVNLIPREINESWFDISARDQLYEYAKADAVSALGIAMKMLPLQIELSKMIGCPLDELAKMGRGKQVEAFLTAESFKRDELVPPKGGSEQTFEGGFVLLPEPGLHEDVIALDFSSMYPTIMISFNISPDTFVNPNDIDNEDVHIAPEVGHAFKKSPDGFFKRLMNNLITRRRLLKADMKHHNKDSDEYQLLNIQQQSVKILTNSFYGYTGWSGAKFYKRECAEATTAWGRHFIKRAIELAEQSGFEVIYGDTDSIFIKFSSNLEGNRKNVLLKKAEEISKQITKELPLELAFQDFFKSIFFTGKKKRYAALTDKDEILVRGLEVRRGDWCDLAKEVQTEVIEIILRNKDPQKAMAYVKGIIKNLESGNLPIEKLIIYKSLTRKIEAYDTKQAHVIAAERALASSACITYEVGSKVPYVILKGAGKTSDRAFPIDIMERNEKNDIYAEGRKYSIDIAYYLAHQLIPAAHRVLQLFDYDKASFDIGNQKTIGDWFYDGRNKEGPRKNIKIDTQIESIENI